MSRIVPSTSSSRATLRKSGAGNGKAIDMISSEPWSIRIAKRAFAAPDDRSRAGNDK